LGVDTEYPLGKGREVRYRCGYPVRHNARFRSLAVVAQAVLHSLVGHFLIHSPAAVRLTLPKAVATEVPEDMTGEAEILWSLPKRESFIPPFMHP
jgi:hypothetical protein